MSSDLWRGPVHYEPPTGKGFQIPDDVIRAVGDGDAALGRTVLGEMFGLHPMQDARIDAAAVREIGNGNINAGRKILSKFIARVRMQRARDAKLRLQHRPRR